jgi:hypothetical protein
MTKKDYVLIAGVIAGRRAAWPNAERVLNDLARELGICLAVENRAFDRARWLKACGAPPAEEVHLTATLKDIARAGAGQ